MVFQLRAPLVSIIISNFNYGKFLKDAIDSARSQTYAHIECIVVDDCSTDNSGEVLDLAQREWPELTVLRLKSNVGQSAALLEGLARASGQFVLFLDADDILFPDCVAYHISAHMCSRRSVGFSCCDAVQIVGEQMVMARNANLSSSFLKLPVDPNLVCNSIISRLAAQGIELPKIEPEKIRHIPAGKGGWPWSTTSSMFFRKDALDLISGATDLRSLTICTDNYLANAINLLTGSILLGEQLVAYRIHGKNNFSTQLILDNFVGHHGKFTNHATKTSEVFINDMITRYGHFSATIENPDRIFEICKQIDVPDPEPDLPRWAARSRFARLLVQHGRELQQHTGQRNLKKWMARARVPFWIRLNFFRRLNRTSPESPQTIKAFSQLRENSKSKAS